MRSNKRGVKCLFLTLIGGLLIQSGSADLFGVTLRERVKQKAALKHQKSDSQKTARQIRDEIFKCNVTSKLYDPVHDKILNKTKLNDMHGISLALCSTNKMNSKNRHDRELFIKSIIAVTNWVNDRIIPKDRQNIAQILRENHLKVYREIDMLELCMGRCTLDDIYLERVN